MAALLWLVQPVNTQSVTYIIQRMTCLAGMFYIMSLLFYVYARLSVVDIKKKEDKRFKCLMRINMNF